MPPRRNGGQAQVVDSVLPPPHPAENFAEVMAFAVEHIAEPVDVDDLARRALMSRRTFDRQFRGVTGMSPLQWLLHQRVLVAQRLLEESDQSVDVVARSVGFGNGIALRRHFHRQVGLSPHQYRVRARAAITERRQYAAG